MAQSLGLLEGPGDPFPFGDVSDHLQDALGGSLANPGDQQRLAVEGISEPGPNPQFVAGERLALPCSLVLANRCAAIVRLDQLDEAPADPIAGQPAGDGPRMPG